ncbi:MAG: hypothetical protein QM784_31130 [Polyangiaceae bacterium]
MALPVARLVVLVPSLDLVWSAEDGVPVAVRVVLLVVLPDAAEVPGLPDVPGPAPSDPLPVFGADAGVSGSDVSALLGLNVVFGLLLGIVDGVLTVLPVGVEPLPAMALGFAFDEGPGLGVEGTASAVAGARLDDVPEHATEPQMQNNATNWSFMLFPLLRLMVRARQLAMEGAARCVGRRLPMSVNLPSTGCNQQQSCPYAGVNTRSGSSANLVT